MLSNLYVMRIVPSSEAPVTIAFDQKKDTVFGVIEDIRCGVPRGERIADLTD